MQRFLISAFIMLAMGGATASFAQSNHTYDDDIYYNPKTEQEDARQNERAQPPQQYAQQGGDQYNDQQQYDPEYEYMNYDDDYYYSTHINQFYYPFYNRPYYSSFYNPYWYNPYLVDPYWGWNPWVNPWYGSFGFSFGFGYGGIGFGYYGGYGGYYGGYGGYYGGYGGYYGGCGGYYPAHYNNVTYGPRYSLNSRQNNVAHTAGYQRLANTSQTGQGKELNGLGADGSRNTNNGSVRNVQNTGVENGAAVESRGATDRSIGNAGTGSAIRSSNLNSGSQSNGAVTKANGAPIRSNGYNSTNENNTAGAGVPIRSGGYNSDNQNSNAGARTPVRSNGYNGNVQNNGTSVEAPIRSSGSSNGRNAVNSFDNSRASNEISSRFERWNGGEARSQSNSAQQIQSPRERGGGLFGGGRSGSGMGSNDRPAMQQQRSFSQPRMEQRSSPSPQMSAPSRSFGGNSGNSGGSGFGGRGGGGGGSMRGGRR